MKRTVEINDKNYKTRVFNLNTFNEFELEEFKNVNTEKNIYEITEVGLDGTRYNSYLTKDIFWELNTFEFVSLDTIYHTSVIYNFINEEKEHFKEKLDYNKIYYIDNDRIRRVNKMYISNNTEMRIYITINDKNIKIAKKDFDKILIKVK